MAQSIEYALVGAIASVIATVAMTQFGDLAADALAHQGQTAFQSALDIAQRGGDVGPTGGAGHASLPLSPIVLDPCEAKPAATAAR